MAQSEDWLYAKRTSLPKPSSSKASGWSSHFISRLTQLSVRSVTHSWKFLSLETFFCIPCGRFYRDLDNLRYLGCQTELDYLEKWRTRRLQRLESADRRAQRGTPDIPIRKVKNDLQQATHNVAGVMNIDLCRMLAGL